MATESLSEPRYLSRREVAALTGASLPTVDRWLYLEDPQERLPSFRPPGGVKVLIDCDEFRRWLDDHRTCGRAPGKRSRA